MELKQVFVTPDGTQFTDKKEAETYLRRPKIKAAFEAFVKNNDQLVNWLIENQESVEMAFEVGKIRRVTKVEFNKLEKALNYVVEKLTGDNKAAFVVENVDAIKESFRWPSVQRMSEEERSTAAKNSLVAASEGNEDLAKWIIENKDAILAAYEAGVEKRVVNAKATEALAAWRAKKAAEKAEKEAAEAAKAGEAKAAE